jgi:glycerol uptake facilitator-like aquaporin
MPIAEDQTSVSEALHAVKPSYPLLEFALTGVLMFFVVTGIRWFVAPSSPFAPEGMDRAIAVVAALTGMVLLCLVVSPWGRRSGGHMNPAVSVALWLMGAFPGAAVVPYVLAQLAGSVAGTALAYLVWGGVVAQPPVEFAVVHAATNWQASETFVAEAACLIVVTLLVGFFLAHPAAAARLPVTLASATVMIIAALGPRSGGSTNPARAFGPALLAGDFGNLAVYLLAPLLGAVLGAGIHRLLVRWTAVRRPRTYRLFHPWSDVPDNVPAPANVEGTDATVVRPPGLAKK